MRSNLRLDLSIFPQPPGGTMKISLVGKDPESIPNGSPAVYRTERGTRIVQGWVVTDPSVLAQLDVPSGETVVEIPDRILPYLAQDS
jgi:hypothetical protein